MNKKTMTILLAITHLLCILLGYCIATIRIATNVEVEPTEAATVVKIDEDTEPTENQTIPTEETKKDAVSKEAEEPAGETKTEVPTETMPVYTQPSVVQPEATQPPVTEPPATQPPVILPPVENETPIG